MKNKIRKILFETIGRLHFQIEKKRSIIILTSSRSGSTWFVESLLDSGRYKLYNQPLDTVYNESKYLKHLPECIVKNPFLINIDRNDYTRFAQFWFKIKTNKIHPNVQWNLLSNEFKFFYRRKLFKVFMGKNQIDFFISNNEYDIIYLTRCPIKRGVSNINYHYQDMGQKMIKNRCFDILSKTDQMFIKETYNSTSSLLTKQIIAWYGENIYMLNKLKHLKQHHSFLHVNYEDLVTDKLASEKKISSFLKENFSLSNKKSKTTNRNKKVSCTAHKNEVQDIIDVFGKYFDSDEIKISDL